VLLDRDAFFAAYKLFNKTFYTRFNDYMDLELTTKLKKPILVVFKFDHLLHELYGEYENNNQSMYELLVSNYNESIAIQIKGLLA